MDLRETGSTTGNRHPWELARIRALGVIARKYGLIRSAARTLDLGCGDGFIIEQLCGHSGSIIDAVDINLTTEQLREFSVKRPRLRFHNDQTLLPEKAYGLLTMFDVLEHIPDAEELNFLRDTVGRFPRPGAFFFCTVPSFQCLYSGHDRFLHHYRRYSRSRLAQVLGSAGLQVIDSGYLFASLLPIRALSVVAEKCFSVVARNPGVGHWQHGPFVTAAVKMLLDADNWLLLRLAGMGIVFPGLTVWAICKTPQ